MKLFQKFRKWYKTNNTDIYVVLAIVTIALLIYLIHSVISTVPSVEFNILDVITPLAAFASVILMYLAFRQSAISNRWNKEKVTYNYYLELTKKHEVEGDEIWDFQYLTSVKELGDIENSWDLQRKLHDSSLLFGRVLNADIPDIQPNQEILNSFFDFIYTYLNYYNRVLNAVEQIRNESLIQENKEDLLRRNGTICKDIFRLNISMSIIEAAIEKQIRLSPPNNEILAKKRYIISELKEIVKKYEGFFL